VFIASGGIKPFFERVYGLTRTKWLEERARAETGRTNRPVFLPRYALLPGAGALGSRERLEAQACEVFSLFMQQAGANRWPKEVPDGGFGR
jgi:hypothetical protein